MEPQRFLADGLDVREVLSVRESWEPVRTADGVNLIAGLLLHFGVKRHRKKKCVVRGDGLK